VPAAGLGDEYFRYEESSQRLIGDETGEAYALGRRLKLRLVEADPVSGALRFALPDQPERSRPDAQRRDRRAPGRRGRPANIRHRGRP
jgi:ribonuclease R